MGLHVCRLAEAARKPKGRANEQYTATAACVPCRAQSDPDTSSGRRTQHVVVWLFRNRNWKFDFTPRGRNAWPAYNGRQHSKETSSCAMNDIATDVSAAIDSG